MSIVSSPEFNALHALPCGTLLGWGILTTTSSTTLLLQNGSLEEANHLPRTYDAVSGEARTKSRFVWFQSLGFDNCALLPLPVRKPGLRAPRCGFQGANWPWVQNSRLTFLSSHMTKLASPLHHSSSPAHREAWWVIPKGVLQPNISISLPFVLLSFLLTFFFFLNSWFFVPMSLHLSPELFLNVYLLLNYHW